MLLMYMSDGLLPHVRLEGLLGQAETSWCPVMSGGGQAEVVPRSDHVIPQRGCEWVGVSLHNLHGLYTSVCKCACVEHPSVCAVIKKHVYSTSALKRFAML